MSSFLSLYIFLFCVLLHKRPTTSFNAKPPILGVGVKGRAKGRRGKVCSCLCVVRNGKCCFHLLRYFVLTLHTRTGSSLFLYNAKGTTLMSSARRKQDKAVTAYAVCNKHYQQKSLLLTATLFPKCMDYWVCPMDYAGSTFFRNVSANLPDYTMSYNRRQYSM